jgi:hypothetical protein
MDYCVKEKRVGKDQPEQWKKKAGALNDPCLSLPCFLML